MNSEGVNRSNRRFLDINPFRKENKMEKHFVIATPIIIFLLQGIFAFLFQPFIFEETIDRISPAFSILRPDTELGGILVSFLIIIYPFIGSEITLQRGLKLKMEKQRIFANIPFVFLFLLYFSLIVFFMLTILHFIINNQLLDVFQVFLERLIKSSQIIFSINLTFGMMIWVIYPFFFSFYNKIFFTID